MLVRDEVYRAHQATDEVDYNVDAFFDLIDDLIPHFVVVALACLFFGICTIVAVSASILLMRKGLRRQCCTLAAILAMYACAALSWTLTMWEYVRYVKYIIRGAAALHCQATWLGSPDQAQCATWNESLSTAAVFAFIHSVEPKAQCGSTTAIITSVVLGDTIVWWRTLAIWPGCRSLYLLAATFLIATVVLGALDASQACDAWPWNTTSGELGIQPWWEPYLEAAFARQNPGLTFAGYLFGSITADISLATNVTATALVGYKAWQHYVFVTKHLPGTSRRTLVIDVLLLFFQSGVLYSMLWIATAGYIATSESSPSKLGVGFAAAAQTALRGCVVELIVLYPMSIILLVGLKKARHNGGTTYGSSIAFVQASRRDGQIGSASNPGPRPHEPRSLLTLAGTDTFVASSSMGASHGSSTVVDVGAPSLTPIAAVHFLRSQVCDAPAVDPHDSESIRT